MPTVVLDDKNTHQQEAVDDGQSEGDPVRPFEGKVHQGPQGQKWKEGIQQLNDGFFVRRLLVGFENFFPVF